MQYKLTAPIGLNTTVKLPASKSISNRALIMCALSGSKTLPSNLSDCDDTTVIINALQNNPYTIDILAAGTAMRFMTAYLAVTPGEHELTGTERMKHRPIGILVDALRHLGADIEYVGEEGYPPLRIKGKQLEGGELSIAGNVSSQYISALLMIGPILSKGLSIRLTGDIISRPYIDLTLWMMREFGADATWTGNDSIRISPKPYIQREYTIESDWSAASYWYEMVALNRKQEDEVRLTGLMDGSKQGDSIVRYIYSLLGVKTTFESTTPNTPSTLKLRNTGRRVPRLEYDFVSAPDLAQTFVTSCCLMGVHFHFTGLQTLKIKETDRIEALKTEMRKLGYVLTDIDGRELLWNGERCDADYSMGLDTYEDHRMALAMAPLAFKADNIVINNPHVVSKSYPHYWDDLRSAGFIIQ